jgi:hypothetical protein
VRVGATSRVDVGGHANGFRAKGRPRTNVRTTGRSCSMQSGPIVRVSHPGAVHRVTIGMERPYPPEDVS